MFAQWQMLTVQVQPLLRIKRGLARSLPSHRLAAPQEPHTVTLSGSIIDSWQLGQQQGRDRSAEGRSGSVHAILIGRHCAIYIRELDAAIEHRRVARLVVLRRHCAISSLGLKTEFIRSVYQPGPREAQLCHHSVGVIVSGSLITYAKGPQADQGSPQSWAGRQIPSRSTTRDCPLPPPPSALVHSRAASIGVSPATCGSQ